ncbi:Replication protein A 14 kDa subunit [Bagarius yarrelli]|uniref:Replication protein A 14 kDa subunit n=1 Tax=Bagarius yarrelli TaxID=175774 RepID=A0A556TP19_BAGYA|nr:Replication protein A 14 kDa subunit [Bagarius yarrelli]
MTGVFESPKPRINSSMLSQYVNSPVSFIGRVEKLEEALSGVVEVVGMVSNKGTIMAATYTVFRDEKGISFDLELYNEALKVLHDFPQYYPFQLSSSAVGCTRRFDPGLWRSYKMKWYYAPLANACAQFWYGGCHGNSNHFDTHQSGMDACARR